LNYLRARWPDEGFDLLNELGRSDVAPERQGRDGDDNHQ
jgi:hypothetical protein